LHAVAFGERVALEVDVAKPRDRPRDERIALQRGIDRAIGVDDQISADRTSGAGMPDLLERDGGRRRPRVGLGQGQQ
jgi:hypothetical protein